jgi:hypothetical protein
LKSYVVEAAMTPPPMTTCSTTSAPSSTHWLAPTTDNNNSYEIDCLCVGTGRFLRSVLIPPLVATQECHPALIQTRGTNFLEFMALQKDPTYPLDTVLYSGSTETVFVKCFGAFSFGTLAHKDAVYQELIHSSTVMKRCNILGVGVTEAGLASPETPVMKDLFELLKVMCEKFNDKTWEPPTTPNQKLCVINTDNVPQNGDVLRQHMMTMASADNNNNNTMIMDYLVHHVAFLNTMVDRITSEREGSKGMIPRCEPIPAKALVLCDPHGDLPPSFSNLGKYGVVIRTDPLYMDGDIALKLRVANATHTAIAQVMALVQWDNTDRLAAAATVATSDTFSTMPSTNNSEPVDTKTQDSVLTATVFMAYLDALVKDQIKPSQFPAFANHSEKEAQAAYDDWRPRLIHPHFGLSTFFITQNAAAKGGIRLGPTVKDLLLRNQPITVTMAYAFAVLLRWLTPRDDEMSHKTTGIFTGWLAGSCRTAAINSSTTPDDSETVMYADGLCHNFNQGWYEFKCACHVSLEDNTDPRVLSEVLASTFGSTAHQPSAYSSVIRAYLLSTEGGNLGTAAASKPAFDTFVKAIATLYARMVAGDSLVEMLEEMVEASGVYSPKGMATEFSALVDDIVLQNDYGSPLFYRPPPIPMSSQLLMTPVLADEMASVVISEVASTLVIDLHTHLLPPSHGSLCLWGIDELLTYVS